MNKRITCLVLLLFIFPFHIFSQRAFTDGEWFKFKIHYGPINTSYATLNVDEAWLNNRKVYHIVGKGKSTGLLNLFFKVNDNYETYVDVKTIKPYRFVRQIDEGGYTKDLVIDFDQDSNKARVTDYKHNETNTYATAEDVQDLLSAFYYIRSDLNSKPLTQGEEYRVNMFFDKENHDFKLKFLGREVLKTKFGKIATLKFRPYVMAGRVFKEQESLTFWVSDDKNKMPVKIQADLAVGSLDADLDEFKGLMHPFKIIMD